MTLMAQENATLPTTDAFGPSSTVTDQRSASTRRMSFDLASELETQEIERNAEFYSTLVQRVRTTGQTVDATDLFGDL